MSTARAGSMARKAIVQAPVRAAPATLPALSNGTSSTGTCNRRPSSVARSTEIPPRTPVTWSRCASTPLPTLMAALIVPAGARSAIAARIDVGSFIVGTPGRACGGRRAKASRELHGLARRGRLLDGRDDLQRRQAVAAGDQRRLGATDHPAELADLQAQRIFRRNGQPLGSIGSHQLGLAGLCQRSRWGIVSEPSVPPMK